MTSIFTVHDHQTKHRQHPVRRFIYFSLLILVLALPLTSRQAFALGGDARTAVQIYIDGELTNLASQSSTVKGALEEAGYTVDPKDVIEPGLDAELMEGFKINVYRAVPVSIEDKNANLEVKTAQKTGQKILEEAGLPYFPEDEFELVSSDISSGDFKPGLTLKVDRATPLQLNLYGAVSEVRTQAETVGEFMTEKGIVLQTGDTLLQPLDQAITEGMTIQVKNDSREVLVVDEEIPMPVEKLQDVNRDTSYRVVNTPGAAGLKKVTYEISKENGQEVARVVLEEVVLKQPVKQVETVGVKKVAPSGANVSAQAKELMAAAGIPESQWSSAYSLIQKESGWNSGSRNRSSGACGLVQAYPCSKLGPNWSDPLVALRWGNSYVNGRYGSWDGAWAHSKARGWY